MIVAPGVSSSGGGRLVGVLDDERDLVMVQCAGRCAALALIDGPADRAVAALLRLVHAWTWRNGLWWCPRCAEPVAAHAFHPASATVAALAYVWSDWCAEPIGAQAMCGRSRDDPAHAVPCPQCTGPSRETVDLVCQRCGTDYGATRR